MIDITRIMEFDAGHRIPNHKSKCRNFHGHRYKIEATIRGAVQPVRGASDDGMVVDFGDLKSIIEAKICEPWDHSFLVYTDDRAAISALRFLQSDHKTVICSFIPTVENMCEFAFDVLRQAVTDTHDLGQHFRLHHVRLYETPNCWADKYAE